MSAIYVNDTLLVTIRGASEGITVPFPDTLTIAAIERYINELEDWLS